MSIRPVEQLLRAVAKNHRVRVKARVPEEAAELPSLVDLYASADWMEREVFDMYGVRFSGHPRMERILLYDGFEGYPLTAAYNCMLRYIKLVQLLFEVNKIESVFRNIPDPCYA